MEAVLHWISENWEAIAGFFITAHTLLSLIAARTPTPRDDEWLATLNGWITRISFLHSVDQRKTLKLPLTRETSRRR